MLKKAKSNGKAKGKSVKDAERYWKQGKEAGNSKGRNKYAYAMGITKKRLGLESCFKNKDVKIIDGRCNLEKILDNRLFEAEEAEESEERKKQQSTEDMQELIQKLPERYHPELRELQNNFNEVSKSPDVDVKKSAKEEYNNSIEALLQKARSEETEEEKWKRESGEAADKKAEELSIAGPSQGMGRRVVKKGTTPKTYDPTLRVGSQFFIIGGLVPGKEERAVGTIVFNDGRKSEGNVVDDNGDEYTIQDGSGKKTKVNKSDVKKIIEPEYEDKGKLRMPKIKRRSGIRTLIGKGFSMAGTIEIDPSGKLGKMDVIGEGWPNKKSASKAKKNRPCQELREQKRSGRLTGFNVIWNDTVTGERGSQTRQEGYFFPIDEDNKEALEKAREQANYVLALKRGDVRTIKIDDPKGWKVYVDGRLKTKDGTPKGEPLITPTAFKAMVGPRSIALSKEGYEDLKFSDKGREKKFKVRKDNDKVIFSEKPQEGESELATKALVPRGGGNLDLSASVDADIRLQEQYGKNTKYPTYGSKTPGVGYTPSAKELKSKKVTQFDELRKKFDDGVINYAQYEGELSRLGINDEDAEKMKNRGIEPKENRGVSRDPNGVVDDLLTDPGDKPYGELTAKEKLQKAARKLNPDDLDKNQAAMNIARKREKRGQKETPPKKKISSQELFKDLFKPKKDKQGLEPEQIADEL